MKYDEIIDQVIEILKGHKEHFVTAYQICQQIEAVHPNLWLQLTSAYPSTDPDIAMGEGTGNYYSPATFVAKALKHHSIENKRIIQEWFSCEGVSFSGVAPGFTGNSVSIWAFRA